MSTIYGPTLDNGYRLEIDWSETNVSTASNSSTVNVTVYWHSLGSAYTISSTATKTGSTTINGTGYSWSVAGAGLTGNQRRSLWSGSQSITHNADGTKSITISSSFDCAVTLGSTYYGTTTASGTADLSDTVTQVTPNVWIWNGSAWVRAKSFKVWKSGAWVDMTTLHAWKSGAWANTL